MTNQEKKEYLSQYCVLAKEVERLSEEINRWQSFAEKITLTYSAQPKGTNTADKIQTAVEKIDCLMRQMANVMVEQAELRSEIYKAVISVNDRTLRLLLSYRYIDGLTWEQIAVKMNYSYVHVCRLHGEALSIMML